MAAVPIALPSHISPAPIVGISDADRRALEMARHDPAAEDPYNGLAAKPSKKRGNIRPIERVKSSELDTETGSKKWPMGRGLQCFIFNGETPTEITLNHITKTFNRGGKAYRSPHAMLIAAEAAGEAAVGARANTWGELCFTDDGGLTWVKGRELRKAWRLRTGGSLRACIRLDV